MSNVHPLLKVHDLWINVWGHLRNKRRDLDMIDALYRAMQAFHENRLAGVIIFRDTPALSKERVLAFCERSVDQLDLPTETLEQLKRNGVRYAGEIFRFDLVDLHHVEWTRPVHQYLLALGFPVRFDPIAFGWVPAYWHDDEVLWSLNQPWNSLKLGELDPWDPCPLKHPDGYYVSDHYIGARMARVNLGHTKFGRWQELLEEAGFENIHAAMYLPEGYQAPAETCPAWDAYQSVRERAQAFARSVLETVDPQRLGTHDVQAAVLLERRQKLVEALKAEGMSPYFFREVVFGRVMREALGGELPPGGIGTLRARATTIRAFLAIPSAAVFTRQTTFADLGRYLWFWGLSVEMKEAELDEILGEE